MRIREIIEIEDSWGKVIIPFKQGPIKRIIFVPAGYTDSELGNEYSYMGLALGKEWFFVIFDFTDKILIGRLIGRGGSVRNDFITRTLSNAKSKKAKLFIRFSQPDSPSGWCFVQGDVSEDVLFCSELIMKKVSELENFWLTSTSSSAATTTSAKRKGSGTGTVSSRENDKKKKKKSVTVAAAAENNFGDRLKNKPDELEAKEADEDQSSSEDDEMGSEEMCEEYSQLLDEYESDSSDDDDDVDNEFGGNKEELLYDSDDDDNFAVDKSRKKTSSRLSRENNKKEKISLLEYFEKMEVPPEALKGLGKNATNLSEAIPELCEKNSELIVALIKKDLANEKRAERIDFSTLEEVEFKWRLHVGETFTRGFGYTSGKERQALVDRIDSEFARSFDVVIGRIKEDCQKNVQEALETPAPVNLAENFVRGKKNITEVLEKLQVLFEPTFLDDKVGQLTKAFRANYGQSSVNNMDDPVPSNDSPAPSQSIVFGVSSSNAGEVFEREKLYGDETFSIDTGIDNVHSLRDLLKQLPAAFDKAESKKDIEIVVSMNLTVSTYAVATIGEEENNAQIKELERDLIEYTKKAGTKIPVPPFASYMKERLPASLCYQNPVANIDKCLEGNPMQHTIKKMDEVAQETSKAALTPAERKKLVIIELQIDLTALRAPGRKYHEHMIQKYAKREMKLNMKLVLDFAFEFGFRITVNSRWFFKRLVKYLQSSSTTIGKEYHTMSAEEDLLSPEVASSLSDENLMKTSSSTEDMCDEKRAARVLNASLAAASEKIFHISVMPLSEKNATSTNHPQQVLHVYCNLHLSQALRHGGNVNMFAIVVLKIMAAYGLSLPDAIQRARSTYYFNNLIARSVVVDFLQERKEKNEEFKNAGKLSYFDVHSFLNPDALKKLICILYSKLPGGEIVDPTNDREQLNAWRTCINLASKTNASELGLWPETIKCSLLRLIGIFTSATYECFGSKGKSWQYDFREFGSIAQLSWLINLTMGVRDTRDKKRALEAAKARNEITTKDIDTSADEEAKKERSSVKLKLAKFASAKKYEKRKAEREKTSDDDSRVLNIVFPRCNFLDAMHASENKVQYICDFEGCGKHFPFRQNLKVHKFTHINKTELPWGCKLCNYKTQTKQNAQRHIERKHPEQAKDSEEAKKFVEDLRRQ